MCMFWVNCCWNFHNKFIKHGSWCAGAEKTEINYCTITGKRVKYKNKANVGDTPLIKKDLCNIISLPLHEIGEIMLL